MRKRIAFFLLGLAMLGAPAHAQNCTAFPNTLANGATADATKVMGNFTYLGNCAAPLANPSFTGKVGIGTVSPLDLLHVYGGDIRVTNTTGNSAITMDATSAANVINFNQAGVLHWALVGSDWNGGSDDFFIARYNNSGSFQGEPLTILRANGYVGINSGNPIGLLDVEGSGGVILNAGNVGIGTTTPAYLLHVGSASASGIVMEFQNSSGACTVAPTASTISISCSSDARLKKDIVDAGAALPALTDMRIRDFTIRATGERKTGVIAQEMLKTHPEMVHKGPDGFYKVDEPDPWKLVKAIQEQQSQINALTKQLADSTAQRRAALDHRGRELVTLKKENTGLASENAHLKAQLLKIDQRLDALETKANVHSASNAGIAVRAVGYRTADSRLR